MKGELQNIGRQWNLTEHCLPSCWRLQRSSAALSHSPENSDRGGSAQKLFIWSTKWGAMDHGMVTRRSAVLASEYSSQGPRVVALW